MAAALLVAQEQVLGVQRVDVGPMRLGLRHRRHRRMLVADERNAEPGEIVLDVGARAEAHASGTSLPGFMSPRGSRARFTSRITATASPCSWATYFSLPKPTPCSPVQVPP